MIEGNLHSSFRKTADPFAVFSERTAAVDQCVLQHFNELLAPAFGDSLSLLAVGGYGRSELFPASDVDLLLLVDKPVEDEARQKAVAAFLRQLWDSGLRISHSVHTISECCAFHLGNTELSISLLDRRRLAGSETLYAQLEGKYANFLRAERNTIIRHLSELTRTRHIKFQNTIYHLEPNIKDGPGGVRDFHLLRWLDTLRNNPHPLDPSLTEAWRFLAAVRSELHFSTNRDSNQLTFELQEALSPQTAAWMRDLFRHLRTIHRATLRSLEAAEEVAAGGLLQQFRDWRSRVSNAEFTVGRERILFRSPQALAQDPQLLFRLFEFVAHHGLPLAPDTEKRVAEHLPKLRRWLTDEPPLWPTLRTIFKEPHAALAIRAMHETGVLDTIFPELSLIDCLVIRDFYHRYTVDEHTFVAIEKLLSLRDQKDDKRSGFADLFSETDAIDLIILALLFHDSGKGAPTTDHSRESSRLAQRAFARIKLPEDASQRCLFLIEQHLILSELMTSRDLSDPDTVATASRKVGTIERLRDLTLLTFADSSAVNPDSMTSWRASQLWRLYLVTHGELTHELDMDRIAATTDPNLEAFLDGFPTRYTLTHNEVEIRSHAQLEAKARHTGAAVEIRRTNGFYEAAIVTSDRPRLFAALAGTLSAFGLNIRRAEAFANNRGIVLDTFVFEDPLRNLELNPSEVDRLKEMLLKSAQGKHDFEKILRNRKPKPRPSSSSRIRPIVSVRPGRSGNSLIEIVAEDRPGLLYDLASAIAESNCSIDTVLIHTEAHKAIDVFYISQQNGPIPEPVSVDLKARLLDICTAPR